MFDFLQKKPVVAPKRDAIEYAMRIHFLRGKSNKDCLDITAVYLPEDGAFDTTAGPYERFREWYIIGTDQFHSIQTENHEIVVDRTTIARLEFTKRKTSI